MAAAVRKKRRRRAGGRGGEPAAQRGRASKALRRLDAPLREWRFEPKVSRRALLGVILLSLSGVAFGAGVYGQWLREAAFGSSPAAPYLLGVGVLLVIGYLLVARDAARALRVGDLGVGYELASGAVRRLGWHDIETITWHDGSLRVKSDATTLMLSAEPHAAAVRRVLAEASRRVPKAVDVHEEDRDRLGAPRASEEEEPVAVDPPQVTGRRCMSSGEPLTFEKDVRMCARCGALYHKVGVPKRCVGCGAKLRR